MENHHVARTSPPIQSTLAATICSGTTYMFDGTELSATGVYTKSFKIAAGCDSLATLTLTVTPPIQSSLAATICSGAKYMFDDTELSAAGVYTKLFKTAAGCDSVAQLTLNVTQLNTLVEQEGSHLRAVENKVDYQWFDCQRQMVLEGENDKIFSMLRIRRFARTIISELDGVHTCVYVAKELY